MYIKSIELHSFRNHRNTIAEFINGTNILVGANAQGKTNLLEAIYLSCVGRGWRAARDIEMVSFNESTATVKTTTTKKFGDITVSVKLGGGNKKSISINGIPISKVGELMGNIPCVFFSPDELRLIKDAPADRRRFLNIDISQIDKSYFYALIRYNKILSQRNAYLKSLPVSAVGTHSPKSDDLRGLALWDEQLVNIGTILINKRIEFVNKLNPYLIDVHNYLTKNAENITFSYVFCGFDDSEEVINNTDNIGNYFIKQLQTAREKDLRLRTTTVGPHRDDLKIEINERDIRTYGSQGQQRTTALAIKIAEMQLFGDITGEKPILLLDDVFSELDSKRQRRLLTFIKNAQTIITTTETPAPLSGGDVKIFNIKGGKIIY
ncbi:MAG: DNA replication/repair protein RecF [Christensenellaceae bacterium]|nr:DNA replication/repair protein RecF [Christensenellaceae bacterium]